MRPVFFVRQLEANRVERFLGDIRLAGMRFFGGVLFLHKKAFYIFLCPNQFLHLIPCLAVVRV